MLTTAIFDLDGTLIDSQGDILDAVRVACAAAGRPVGSIDPSVIGLSIKDIALSIFGDRFEEVFPPFERAFRASYDERSHELSRLYPGTLETLEALAEGGVELYLATMKPKKPTAAILGQFGLEPYFAAWRSSNSWDGPKLSKAELVSRVVEEEALAKGECAYIGDHPDDIRAARSAGLASVAALYGYGDKAIIEGCGPDYRIGRIGELADIYMKGNNTNG